tara:strand:+ start:286 stop:720 length:435 start_codon:yes stop_codon:yes gene_type:complete
MVSDKKITSQKELMTRIAQIKAENSRTWYDEGSDRMRTQTPPVAVKFAMNSYDFNGVRLDLEVNGKQLKYILAQLKRHEENFVTEREWCNEAHHEYNLYHYPRCDSIKLTVNFEHDSTRFQDNGEGNYVGYINSDGEKVRWDKD